MLHPTATSTPHQLVNLLGVGEFLPSRRSAADLFGRMCEGAPLLCVSVITAICGFNPRNVNMTLLPEYVRYSPSGTSVRVRVGGPQRGGSRPCDWCWAGLGEQRLSGWSPAYLLSAAGGAS